MSEREIMDYGLRTKKAQRKRGMKIISFFIILLFLGVGAYIVLGKTGSEAWNCNAQKTITVVDNGLEFPFADVAEKTVGELLLSKKIILTLGDSIFPDVEAPLFSGTRILIARSHPLSVVVDGGEQVLHTQALSVGQALEESTIAIDEDDIVKPSRDMFAVNGIRVVITRVQIEEQSVEKPIAFDKKVNEDGNLSWRKNVVTQKGENGIQKLIYRVSKYDGREVNRKLLNTEVIRDPVAQIVTQGTHVQLGKSHSGGASWYAFTGTMAAANPWLPMGSYVKVTNVGNGKSVIVKINDRGPFVPGRIIDLDKAAFTRIASIGAGVINVKMEEIIN